MNQTIAILQGGDSSEKEVSLKSAATVKEVLDNIGYQTVLVNIDQSGWMAEVEGQQLVIDKNDFSVQTTSQKLKFDGVFVVIHGTPGEDGKLQSYFDLLSIPYNTCNAMQSALTFDKAQCNKLLSAYGIKVPESRIFHQEDLETLKGSIHSFSYPVIVKPNQAGSSFGISKVDQAEDLLLAVEDAFKHDSQVNIDEFISGTEVSCGVHDLFGRIEALPSTEIVTKNAFFDYEAKYLGKSQEITPARISDKMAQKVAAITCRVFEVLQLKGVSRVDYIIKDETPYLIEVNTVPGLSKESIIPQQVKEAGYTLEEFFKAWVASIFNKSNS